jgi:hypothetical protein
LRKLLTVALWSVLTLASATPALAQSSDDSGDTGEEGDTSSAAQSQYGPESIESAADAARRAASHASEASEAFEEAREAAKAAGADDELASALAAEVVAARDETGSEDGSDGSAEATPEKQLPETGGNSIFILATGILLLACGLVVRGVIR